MTTLEDAVLEAMRFMLDTISWKDPDGVATGYGALDQMLRGLRKGSLTVLSSPPSLGKTSFALNVVRNQFGKKTELPILYASTLGHTELFLRLLTIVSGLEFRFDHNLIGDRPDRMAGAVESMRRYPLNFADSRKPDDLFFRELAELQERNRFGLIIVDPARGERLARLKECAQYLETPILALVTADKKGRPVPETEMADAVIELRRDRKADGEEAAVSLTVSRNRFGLCGTTLLSFRPRTMKFLDPVADRAREEEEEEKKAARSITFSRKRRF